MTCRASGRIGLLESRVAYLMESVERLQATLRQAHINYEPTPEKGTHVAGESARAAD